MTCADLASQRLATTEERWVLIGGDARLIRAQVRDLLLRLALSLAI